MVVSTTATTQGVNYLSFDMGFSVHTPRGMEAGGSPALAWVGDADRVPAPVACCQELGAERMCGMHIDAP